MKIEDVSSSWQTDALERMIYTKLDPEALELR